MAVSSKKNSLPSRAAPPTAAATAILNVAERLAQTRGYNGFSYADIAAQLGVTKASLHYHFPSKAELGRALMSAITYSLERRSTRLTDRLRSREKS